MAKSDCRLAKFCTAIRFFLQGRILLIGSDAITYNLDLTSRLLCPHYTHMTANKINVIDIVVRNTLKKFLVLLIYREWNYHSPILPVDEPTEVDSRNCLPISRYDFWRATYKLPVIIAKELDVEEKSCSVKVPGLARYIMYKEGREMTVVVERENELIPIVWLPDGRVCIGLSSYLILMNKSDVCTERKSRHSQKLPPWIPTVGGLMVQNLTAKKIFDSISSGSTIYKDAHEVLSRMCLCNVQGKKTSPLMRCLKNSIQFVKILWTCGGMIYGARSRLHEEQVYSVAVDYLSNGLKRTRSPQ
ncbi:hypothetical protein Tco_0111083 [Tanacetum coccineum]